LQHGAMNALTLPEALRFNEEVAPDAVSNFRQAVGIDVEELARLGGFERLRQFGVPKGDLAGIAEATVQRAGAKANPRPASAADVEQLLHNIY
jgi:alcohol dehydrogenase class IV